MISIREADSNDAPVIAEFQQMMARETENLELKKEKVISGVTAVMADRTKGFYIVSEDAGRLVASMLLTPEWSDWRNGFVLWIQSLYVIPELRKKGVFRNMYDFVKGIVMGSEKYVGIKLYVDQHNIKAQKAYSKVGMDASHYRLFEWNK